MKEHIKAVLEYCQENDVEINFSPDGIGVWSAGDHLHLKIESVEAKIDEVEPSVDALNSLRAWGWEQS